MIDGPHRIFINTLSVAVAPVATGTHEPVSCLRFSLHPLTVKWSHGRGGLVAVLTHTLSLTRKVTLEADRAAELKGGPQLCKATAMDLIIASIPSKVRHGKLIRWCQAPQPSPQRLQRVKSHLALMFALCYATFESVEVSRRGVAESFGIMADQDFLLRVRGGKTSTARADIQTTELLSSFCTAAAALSPVNLLVLSNGLYNFLQEVVIEQKKQGLFSAYAKSSIFLIQY
jgi:hypothetical protein